MEKTTPADAMGAADAAPLRSGYGGMPPEIADESVPRVGGYEILAKLGVGGMSTVWHARQLSTRREVALKLLNTFGGGGQRLGQRFEREVELMARLQHPHIARVYDSGVLQGVYFYAMELVDGLPLDAYAAEHRLDRGQILSLVRVVCAAVQHAHQRGVIHRDLKPSNILIDRDGQPRVLDFGLARQVLLDPAGPQISLEGEWAGTPAFMSPEQATGGGDDLDTRTDIYSLGVCLYRLVTGRYPHDVSGSAIEVLRRIQAEEVVRPDRATRDMDGDLQAILLKALAKQPDARYSSAAALAEDIRRYLDGEPLEARPVTPAYLLRKLVRKHWRGVAVASGTVACLLALFAFAWIRINAARAQAESSAASEREQTRLAHLRLADGLVAEGDRLAQARYWPNARAAYRDARGYYERYNVSSIAATSGLAEALARAPEPSREYKGFDEPVVAAGFPADADRRAFVVLRSGRTAHLDLDTGAITGSGPGPRGRTATAVTFAPDRRRALVAIQTGTHIRNRETTFQVFDASQNLPLEFRSVKGGVGSNVLLSPSPASVVFAGNVGSVNGSGTSLLHMELDGDRSAAPTEFRGSEELTLRALALGGAQRAIIGADNGGSLHFWNYATGEKAGSIGGDGRSIRAIAASSDGGLLISGGDDGGVRLWDLDARRVIRGLEWHTERVVSVALSPAGDLALSGDVGGNVCLWSTPDGVLRQIFSRPAAARVHVEFAADGRTVMTAGNGIVETWALAPPSASAPVMDAAGSCVAVSRDGSSIAVGDAGGKATLLDVRTGEVLGRLGSAAARPEPVRDVGFSGDGRALYVVGIDGVRRLDRPLPAPGPAGGDSPVLKGSDYCAVSPDGRFALRAGMGGVALSDLNASAPDVVLDNVTARTAGFSPTGATVFVLAGAGGAKFIDVANGTIRATLTAADVPLTAAAIDRSDGLAVVGATDGSLRFVDLKTGDERARLQGHGGAVHGLKFVADGSCLLSSGADGTVRIWNVAAAREVRRLSGIDDIIRSFELLEDRVLVLVGTGVHAYDLRTLTCRHFR